MALSSYKKSLLAFGSAIYLITLAFLSPALAREQNEFPGRRVGGGSRGECAVDADAFVALNPANHLGITRQDRPQLYFFVAESTETYQVRLELFESDEDNLIGEIRYETTLAVGAEQDLIEIQLPEDILEPGLYYPWQFVVLCDPGDPSRNIVLAGWISQDATGEWDAIAPGLSVEEKLAQAQLYQASGLWLDAIALSVDLIQSEPNLEVVQTQWLQLLRGLELDDVLNHTLAIQVLGDRP
ncbi:MAG: DUF928 domain-containing protein [Cyanobacteria bacterium]|nr:DUF928 domain-containing protein [Cyanobacteriota bacterium]